MSENPDDHPSKRRRILPSPKPNEDQEDNEIEGIFQGMRIYIHDRINPARRRVLRSLITQHGGINSVNADENVTHILVDENMLAAQLCHDLQWRCYIPQNIHVLMVGWVSSCIHANRILNGRHFLYSCPRGPMVTASIDSSNSDNGEDVEASVEDNGYTRGRRFSRPKYPRRDYENIDNDERKFWSPLEEGSSYDDQNYNCETTCDDEWLLIPLPDPPVSPVPTESAENKKAGVEKDAAENIEVGVEKNGLNNADDVSTKERKSKHETEEAKDAGRTKVKKANKKRDRNKPQDAVIYNPGPSTSTNVNFSPAKTPMVPFDQRPDNTVGRLSRLRLKVVPNPDGTGKKWVVVNMNKPNENEQAPKEAVPNSTVQENSSIKESGSTFATAAHNLPGITAISSNTVSTKHCPIEVSSLNGKDMQDLPSHQDKLSDDVNLGIRTTETMYQQGHKRKKETTSSEEANEVTNQERSAFSRIENVISSNKKMSKRKQSKCNSVPLSEEQESTDQRPVPKRRKKTRFQKKEDGNTSESTSSNVQDESTGKISLSKPKKTKLENTCLFPNVQGGTSNLVEQPLSEEEAGRFSRRKHRKSISTPASPVSEGIGGKFPCANKKKNNSTPASPNDKSWNYKINENIPHSNLNSTNTIFDKKSVDAENIPSSTIPNKKDEIRKYVMNFFAANLPNNDGEFKKERKRKRSSDDELHSTEIPKQSYSRHTDILSGVPLNLDFTMEEISKGKHSVCQQTPIKRSDFNESVFPTRVAPNQCPKSTLAKSSKPSQGNKIPTLAESNTSVESTSSQIVKSVIQFAALNGNSSACSTSHLIDLQRDRIALDQSASKDSPKYTGASTNEKFDIISAEEIKSNKIVVDEAFKAESIASTVENSQDKLYSTPASPRYEVAAQTIADLTNKICKDLEVENFNISEMKTYPIELQCALDFDVELRLSELFFSPKKTQAANEIRFLEAELERRKYGSGSWQIKEFNDFINGKSKSKLAEEERLKNKLIIGYWESIDDSDAAMPISFQTEPERVNGDEPINFPRINEERSHETPVVGRDLIFPLPEPSDVISMPEVVSTDVSMDGKKVIKHYLSPLCPNYSIIQKLQHLYEFFKKTKDIWRMHAYEQAIFALGKHPTLIRSLEEAQSIKGVGKTIAFKVWEIIRTGNLQEIEEFCNKEWVTARKLLTKGWGITTKLARRLYRENLSNVNQVWVGANLSRSQRLGLKYYEHLSKKMTRAEADEIARIVNCFVRLRNRKCVVEPCSSIRRNKKFCGHVSILVILERGNNKGHRLLDDTIAAMHREGYVIDDLMRHEENGTQCRYIGLFQINPKARYRRFDLTIVPYIEQVCARLFLTGPSYFLRAAIKFAERRDMILDEHCVRLNFLDENGRLLKVDPVYLSSERDLFTMIEIPYRSPEQRDIIPFSTVVKK